MKKEVFVSNYLYKTEYGRILAEQLETKLEIFGYELTKLSLKEKNEWCRDYLPVKSATGKLIQFVYKPSYLSENDKRIPKVDDFYKIIGSPDDLSKIILDGGAIEVYGNTGIISDRVFRDNPQAEKDIMEEIKSKLELSKLIVVPQHPYDFTGHVDGLVRFVDHTRVVINDFSYILKQSQTDNRYRYRLEEAWYYAFRYALINAGLYLIEIPCTVKKNTNDKSTCGIYLNFLKLPNLLIIPRFGQPIKDNVAEEKLRSVYEGYEVTGVEAKELAEEGGVINCVTWN